MLKNFLQTKETIQKIPSFFFRELQLITVLLLICDRHMRSSTSFVSLKLCEIFHFQFRFVIVKVHIYIKKNTWTL